MKTVSHILALFLSLGLFACSGHSDHDHEEEHLHDAHITLSAYTDMFEVFISGSPLVSGHESKFMIHVTQLSTFKPLEKANVKVQFTGTGNDATISAGASDEAGIYTVVYTPKEPGTVKMDVTIEAGGRTQIVIFADLTVFADEHVAHEAAAAAEIKHPNGIAFSKEKAWLIDFATATVAAGAAGTGIEAMAYVEPTSDGARTLNATTRGKVVILNSHLAIGEQVGAGAALFRVDASGLAEGDMRLQINQAQTEFNRAKTEYNRLKGLYEEKLTTAAEVNRAKAEYEQAATQLNALKSGFSGGGQTIASPISGYIQSLDVANGQWVEAGQPLATVANSRNIRLSAKIPSRYASQSSRITNALIFPTAGGEAVSLKSEGGHIISDKALIKPGEAMITISMEMPNRLNLIPGSYVPVLLQTASESAAITIPRQAIVEEFGNTFVMVQLSPEYFEKREVKLGDINGSGYEVLSGLKEGERIVTKGAGIIKLSQGSAALDPHAGHGH